MTSHAALWADTSNAMWLGIGLLAAGFILGGLVLYLISRKEREVDNDG